MLIMNYQMTPQNAPIQIYILCHPIFLAIYRFKLQYFDDVTNKIWELFIELDFVLIFLYSLSLCL